MRENILKIATLVALTGAITTASAEINYMELVVNYKSCNNGNQVACKRFNELSAVADREGFSEAKLQKAAREHQAYLDSVEYTTEQVQYNLNTMNGIFGGGFDY